MGRESALWANMREKMGRGKFWQEATRHEDAIQAGIADVSYVSNGGHHGWIELKDVNEWPKRESTILRLPHYTDEQKIWLNRKGSRGGFTWLFLRVARDYMLFDWLAAQDVGQLTRDALIERTTGCWLKKMDWQELGEWLDRGQNF